MLLPYAIEQIQLPHYKYVRDINQQWHIIYQNMTSWNIYLVIATYVEKSVTSFYIYAVYSISFRGRCGGWVCIYVPNVKHQHEITDQEHCTLNVVNYI